MTTCTNCGHAIEGDFKFCPSCGTQTTGVGPDGSLVGRTFNDKYRILSELGSGSMGTVYLAEHIGLKKRVAVKVLHPDLQVGQESIRRFHREGIAAGQFSHPGAIQIFDFDQGDSNLFYLAMEFVEGPTLKELIRREGRLTPDDAADVARQILSVLAEAHRHGIVHRDLKPENIMVVEGATGERTIKVLDFGLSKLVDRPIEASVRTEVGRLLGTPLYMAPEQCTGDEVDARSDLYSTGLILYEMLVGEPPFGGKTIAEILGKHTSQSAPSISDSHPQARVPTDLDEIVLRALEKRREDRFQSAAEMIAALDEVRFERFGRPRRRPASRGAPAPAGSRRERRLAPVVLGALLLAGAGGLAWYFLGRGAPASDAARVRLIPAESRSAEETRYVGLLDDAGTALRADRLGDARVSVNEALRLACADAEALLLRARVFELEGDADAARADFRDALEDDPCYVDAAVAAGRFHLARGELERARELFESARGCDAGSGAAVAGLAAVRHAEGDAEEARALAAEALRLDPESAAAHYWSGLLALEAGELEAAVDALVEAKRRDPQDWRAYAALGRAYQASGRGTEAERQLREALARRPDAAEPRLELAALCLEAGRAEEARELLEEAPAALADDPRVAGLRGAALLVLGQVARAREALEQAASRSPDDARLQALLGNVLQEAGAPREALAAYDRALERDADLALALRGRGLALFELERWEEAADALRRAVELDPDHAFAHFALGVLDMEYLNRPQDALASLQRYRDLGGRDPRVDGWIAQLSQ